MVWDSHSTHDQYLISRFLGEFRVLKNCFQPGVSRQSAAPYKHHISYGKSFKKFNVGGGGGVVACLIIVSLQILDMGVDLELDNHFDHSNRVPYTQGNSILISLHNALLKSTLFTINKYQCFSESRVIVPTQSNH